MVKEKRDKVIRRYDPDRYYLGIIMGKIDIMEKHGLDPKYSRGTAGLRLMAKLHAGWNDYDSHAALKCMAVRCIEITKGYK